MTDTVATPADAAVLSAGQWVWDANGEPLCLVDTCIGWPQRMWQHQGGHAWTAIDNVPYPLTLAELDESDYACPHASTQECGHCRRCGRVVAEPRPQPASPEELAHLRAVLAATSRKDTA